VRPLDPPSQAKLILSFDFDGTLHSPDETPPVSGAFFELIRKLREERDAVWGINTGRSMNHVIEGLVESRFPFSPDWVVAREREIWYPNNFGRWIGDEKWNRTCEKNHRKFFRKVGKDLKAIRSEVEEHTGATWIEQEGEPAGLISRTEEEMEWIVGRVRELTVSEPLLGWQRNTIYLRFGHRNYQKGSSLVQVASGFGLGPASSLAIGDSHNDLEMLSPDAAAMIACPGNSVPEVKSQVERVGGYLCRDVHSTACVEALEHFLG
jgi:hydroxymethylpyrimidine pyrophosphatase-like HAD family hydrolase